MKRHTPRLIAYGLAFLLAGLSLLMDFSTDYLITLGISLAILALFVFVGKNKTLAGTAPTFVLSWIYFGIVFPAETPGPEALLESLSVLTDYLDSTSPMLAFFAIGLIAAQIFLRKSDNIFFIILRYVAMGGTLFTWCAGMGSNAQPLNFLLLMDIALCLSGELQTRKLGARKGRTIPCLLWGFAVLMINCIGGGSAVFAVTALLQLNAGSLFTILGIALLGALLVVEEKALGKSANFAGLGGMLVYWSITALIMLLYPQVANMSMLIVLPFVLFYAYRSFARTWSSLPGRTMTATLYHSLWCLAFLGVILISKCFNDGNFLATVFLVLAPVAAAVCWSVSRQRGKEAQVMTGYLGVATALLLCFARQIDLNDVTMLVTKILTAVGLGVFWCLVSSHIAKLDRTSSAADKSEFSIVRTVHVFVPLTVLAVAVFKILSI